MKQSKGRQLGALLAMMLIVGMAFVLAVSAHFTGVSDVDDM